MTLARETYPELRSQYQEDLRGCLKLAAAANVIDCFREPGSIKDNAGELCFDLPLVNWMQQFAQVTYVVKPSPIQDDLTLEDVKRSGLQRKFGKVISTGIASPGVVFSLASLQFQQEFESADFIFAKGMGIMRLYQRSPRKASFSIALWRSASR